jgi:serine/threonine protein kinase
MVNASLDELVSRWFELREAGKATSPEGLCAGCPQLLPELRERLKQLESMEKFVCPGAPETKSEAESWPIVPEKPPPSEDRSKFPFLEPPQAADEMGRLGKFRILRLLGEGGMGFVLEAEDSELERRVALKVMRPEIAEKETARQRFLRGAKAMAAVKHDRVIAVYDSREECTPVGPVPFLVMPLLDGETLGRG